MKRNYPTNLTDSQYDTILRIIGYKRKRQHSLKEVLNALFYLLKTGCQWRMLPKDFPPHDTVFQADYSITRCVVTTEKEASSQKSREFASTFGKKSTVHYGLYQMHGFISAIDAQKYGFTETDLELLWEALLNAFEHDRSSARGEMNPRALILFKHNSHVGAWIETIEILYPCLSQS